MKKVPVKCAGHGNLLVKYIPPCAEYPNGAIERKGRCHGEKCDTVFTIPERLESGAPLMLGCAHEIPSRPPIPNTTPSN